MTTSLPSKRKLLVALVEGDPLRLLGFRALLESELELEIISASFCEIAIQANIDVALIRDRIGQNLSGAMSELRMARPDLPIIVIGPSTEDMCLMDRRPGNLRERFAS
jgi:vacuolar-type H+-ATPase subunit F/Vma7